MKYFFNFVLPLRGLIVGGVYPEGATRSPNGVRRAAPLPGQRRRRAAHESAYSAKDDGFLRPCGVESVGGARRSHGRLWLGALHVNAMRRKKIYKLK